MEPVLGDDLDNGMPEVIENVADACLRGKTVARAVHTSTICGSRVTMWFRDKACVVLLEGCGGKSFRMNHHFTFVRLSERVGMTLFMCPAMTNQCLSCWRR